jgi:hypothetical protein
MNGAARFSPFGHYAHWPHGSTMTLSASISHVGLGGLVGLVIRIECENPFYNNRMDLVILDL